MNEETINWVNVSERLPETESYYMVKFDDGEIDEKPFRIRPNQNIRGFMTERRVIQWTELF